MRFIILLMVTPLLASPALASSRLESVAKVATCSDAGKNTCEATPALKKVFTLLGQEAPKSFADTIDAAQKTWQRPEGTERWQIKERFTDKRDALLLLMKELGFTDAIHAREKHYEYAAIHGATLRTVESRIKWLVKEWKRGVRFDAVIILSGERKLDKALELSEINKRWRCPEVMPENETQMIQWLWNETELPKEMRRLPFTLVNAKASNWRAHTGDTVNAWLASAPKAGSILAVSNQPYVSYQDMSLRNRLPSSFTLETVGERAGDDIMNSVYLDNIAALLLQLRKWQEPS
jgi:hypothetical protein